MSLAQPCVGGANRNLAYLIIHGIDHKVAESSKSLMSIRI